MKKPKCVVQGYPVWWHHHGSKMGVSSYCLGEENRSIAIHGSAANVKIEVCKGLPGEIYWVIDWEIVFFKGYGVKGKTYLTNEELKSAFGLSDKTEESSKWIIDEYGGSTACQGGFIQYCQYLNIPGPGTGHDGDPNISIEITDEMRKIVEKITK